MKKQNLKNLLIMLLLGLGLSSQAQSLHYGIKGGTNFAVQSDIADYYNNRDIRVAMQAGVFGNYAFSENIILQAEALYEQMGSENSSVINKYDYISVPVIMKYNMGESLRTPLFFNFHTGVSVAYLLNAESEIKAKESMGTIDLKKDSKEIQFGTLLGIGMSYPLDKSAINLDLRLELGLTDYSELLANQKNKLVSLSLAYQF